MFNIRSIMPANTYSLVLRFLAVLTLAITCTFALTSCSSDPEIATPPSDDDQEEQTVETDDEAEDTTETDADTTDDEAADTTDEDADAETTEDEETVATHEGAYVITILNAGGADGLAAATEETLATNGIEGDDYEITTDTYQGGTIASTVVYVTGEGDDAEAVQAEAEQIADILGATVETFDSTQITATTMDDIDILILVGADAA